MSDLIDENEHILLQVNACVGTCVLTHTLLLCDFYVVPCETGPPCRQETVISEEKQLKATQDNLFQRSPQKLHIMHSHLRTETHNLDVPFNHSCIKRKTVHPGSTLDISHYFCLQCLVRHQSPPQVQNMKAAEGLRATQRLCSDRGDPRLTMVKRALFINTICILFSL